MQKIYLSTVIPVYKDGLFLEELVNKLDVVRNKPIKNNAPLELIEAIFIDDSRASRGIGSR